MWPPAKKISWYMLAPGRLVSSMPKAMVHISRGSYFLWTPRYSKKQAMAIITRFFQPPAWKNW